MVRLTPRFVAAGFFVLAGVYAATPSAAPHKPFTESQKRWWAFQPVVKPAVPVVKNRAWVRTPVDAFVLAKLEEKGISPSGPADRVTLIRRASLG